MKNIIKFICFLIYTIALFYIKDYFVLFVLFSFQLLLMFMANVSIKGVIKTIFHLMPFILFTVIINAFVMSLEEAILIGIRLIIVCYMTYIFGKTTTAMEIAKVIQNLLYPLTWFKINTQNIGIMVSIGITFIPIIKKEIENIENSLIAKGFNMSFKNKVKHIKYIMGPLFYSLIKRVKQMEDSLKSKAYIED